MPFDCIYQLRIVDGPGQGRVIPLDEAELTLGRAKGVRDRIPGWIFLHDNTVSRLHCVLNWSGKNRSFILQHRSETNRTWHGEQAISQPVVLSVGDHISLGRVRLVYEHFRESGAQVDTLEFDGRRPQQRPPTLREGFELKVTSGPDQGKTCPLRWDVVVVGRQPTLPADAYLRLTDATVALDQLALRWSGSGFEVWAAENDQNTLCREWGERLWNTLLVAGQPLALRHRDSLKFGATELSFRAYARSVGGGQSPNKLGELLRDLSWGTAGNAPERGDVLMICREPQQLALVLSPKSYNRATGKALCAHMTPNKQGYPFEVAIPGKTEILGVVLADQPCSVPWGEEQIEPICAVSADTVDEVLARMHTLTAES